MGSARLIEGWGMPKARIANDLLLVNRALEVRHFVRIEREKDGEQFEVDLVGAWPQPKSQLLFKAANRQSKQLGDFTHMGYDVHITRKTNGFDEDGPRISEDEWRAYVASDSEMVMSGVAEHTNPQGETIRLTQPLLTEWRRHSSGSTVWFSYFEGSVAVKNPDDECLAKMKQVATTLQARVQGDDGEIYDGSANLPQQPTLSFGERVAGWFAQLRPPRRPKIELEPLPFGVGDRVRDSWGNEHTVISIDRKAEHGMGVIRTLRGDGTEHAHAMIAHGLKAVAK